MVEVVVVGDLVVVVLNMVVIEMVVERVVVVIRVDMDWVLVV